MHDAGLAIVVAAALVFGYTNGFHDSANAIATSISTRALKPRVALAIAAAANFVGTLVASGVAATISHGLIGAPHGSGGMVLLFAAMIGAITWNLTTWRFGIPSSSSHALVGGLVGAALAAAGTSAVQWHGVFVKVIVPTVISPLIGVAAGYIVMVVILWTFRRGKPTKLNKRFRIAQTLSATFMAYSHGTQDAQKVVGVVVLALVVGGEQHSFAAPLWVNLVVAAVIGLGTYSGGKRIIGTLGRRIVKLEPAQGFSAEVTSAAVLLVNSYLGYAISTTHVITSSIMGVGSVRRFKAVRWGLAGNIVVAWIITIPAAAAVAAAVYGISSALVL